MTESLKRNFEPGKLLLVATILMSLTLVSQLYIISESMDLSDGIQLGGIEVSMVASYVFTALSMVIVINEFFQFKTKMKGLMVLEKLMIKEPPRPVVPTIISVPDIETPILEPITDENSETDLEFENLLNDELVESPHVDAETLNKYKTTKIKIEETQGIC